MSKYYSINKFSKILGISVQTLRWDKKGNYSPPYHTSSNGYDIIGIDNQIKL